MANPRTKESFNTILEHYTKVSIAQKLAKVIQREESLYNKWYKEVKSLSNKLLKGETTIIRNGNTLEIVVLLATARPEHEKACRRFLDSLKLAFPYCHATQKAIETKTDDSGKIAFSISIPGAKVKKPKRETKNAKKNGNKK